ncbi:UDP-N-acetylmuramate dehydrogenase [Chitinivorax tropicus]|uniref:UDP-N-acetylenolpyruvoylglucosamine reductase n=1 Tax=Chitinivorax tropicus TaxID=714531 RepID=A0A840MN14_9PROT|nr:UDP-N-acetylmuramate dehydrogenase [Chitinivorax tropicus]MBB5018855.1 UDP-N-acetylmuramate dehydrogenase [Chitinivorax tropicus]
MRGRQLAHAPTAGQVSWRAGGAVKRAVWPADLTDLQTWLADLPADEKVVFIGAGTSLLVRDGGFDGNVVFTQPGLMAIQAASPDDNCPGVYAEAGASASKLAEWAAQQGLTGLEFLAGIPGTVGGALVGNAGCFSSETWDGVVAVQTIDRQGRLQRRPASDYRVGYRQVSRYQAGEPEWFVGAWFTLRPTQQREATQTVADLLAQRARQQPLDQPNAGRVFRNPPGMVASELLKQMGFAGKRRGEASFSRQHPNFIVNRGGASAADIESLIIDAQQLAKAQFGIELVVEATIIGDW